MIVGQLGVDVGHCGAEGDDDALDEVEVDEHED